MAKSNIKRKKYLNNYQIISIISIPLLYVIDMLIPQTNARELIWVAFSTNIIGGYFFLQLWHKDGITWFRNSDTNYNRGLTRKSSDACLLILVIQTMIFCLLFIFVEFNTLVTNETIVAIMFVISIISMILMHFITKQTHKKVLDIIPKKK